MRGSKRAAFFDVDGTLLKGNIVRYYASIRLASLPSWARPIWMVGFLPRTLYYLWLDRRSRRRFARVFYRNYRGFETKQLESAARDFAQRHLIPKIYPEALERVQGHQRKGEEVYLITGSLRQLVAPLAESLGVRHIEAAELAFEGGRCTGELSRGPLTDTAKRAAIEEAARRDDVDLEASCAYADSWDDLPMLECVGHPVAVNPQERLRTVAQRRGWEIVAWKCG